eukprot:NODE_549_length_6847_cov_0.284084.p2 type:complete len:301 gc:universal NODE_549_length_6847_cov_0.284084:5393-6295(+)
MTSVGRIAFKVNEMDYYNNASQTANNKVFPDSVSKKTFCSPSTFHSIQTNKNFSSQTTAYCQKIGRLVSVRIYVPHDENFKTKTVITIQRWWRIQMAVGKIFAVIKEWNLYCQERVVQREHSRVKAVKEAKEDKIKRTYPHTRAHVNFWEEELLKWKKEQLQKLENNSDKEYRRKINLEILEYEAKIYRDLSHRMYLYQKKRIIEKRVEFLEDSAKSLKYSVLTDNPATLGAADVLLQYNLIIGESEDMIERLKVHKNKEIQMLSLREEEFRKRSLKVNGIRHRLGYAFFKFAESVVDFS